LKTLLVNMLGFYVLLMFCGLAIAAETFPERKTDGITREAWKVNQKQQYDGLNYRIEQSSMAAAAVIEFNDKDAEYIDQENDKAYSSAPYMVGVVKPLSFHIDMANLKRDMLSAEYLAFADGVVRLTETNHLAWALRLDAVNVGGIRLRFDDVNLPEGAQIYVYNSQGDVRGPYTGQYDSLWTHSIGGDSIFVQVVLPYATESDIAQIRFQLGAVLLIDPSPQAFCPQNASCIEDGSCFDTVDWANIDMLRDAVANMLYIKGGNGFICTGGLLNDKDTSSFIPYFLTANHCIDTAAVAATMETRFDYRTSICGGSCSWPSSPTTNGATLLHTSSQDDHTLLRLNEDPPGDNWFLGWTSTAVANSHGTMLYRLSHPKQAPQAFSTHSVDVNYGICSGLPLGRYIYSRDIIGATEGGSSGSPVVNTNAQVVGQLLGACGTNLDDVCDSDNNATVDGAFANYFDDVAQWLNVPNSASDLVVINPSVSNSILEPSESFTINATVENQGSESANGTTLKYYRSTNSIISSTDTLLGTDPVSGLPPNGTSPESLSTAAPNSTGTYWVGACVDSVSGESNINNNCSSGVEVQVSHDSPPTGPDPTFTDVPKSYWAYESIEILVANSITSGCGNEKYCPESSVTRAQMAIFLERGINGGDYSPPPATGTLFNDVPLGSFAAAWIEQLFKDGITSGCGNRNYCPDANITRAQMAVFLLRAKYGSTYTPPPATGTMFNDVNAGSFAAAWIEQLAKEGITGGCGGGNYCPNASVTRAQMAAFLAQQKDFLR